MEITVRGREQEYIHTADNLRYLYYIINKKDTLQFNAVNHLLENLPSHELYLELSPTPDNTNTSQRMQLFKHCLLTLFEVDLCPTLVRKY